MKKILGMLLIIFAFSNTVYGYSSGFEYMLNKMGISQKNVNGYYLNEEIYNKYNLLVYGNPLYMYKNQRWKETDIGNWTYNGGVWNGEGIRGEYWILGETYAGKEVHNEVFPDDYNSGISPLDWNYIEIIDANESWLDISKYQTEKQKEYMLNQKLSRNNVTYDLTANQIGTNKARAESFATWKTKGSVYTRKKDNKGIIWGATFSVPPMAADAKLNANLNFEKGLKYTITEDKNEINIKISYGAIISNISDYVSKEDIKNLTVDLSINDIGVKTITVEKELAVNNEYILKVNKSDYANESAVEISVKCNAIAETCFETDIPMYDSKEEILIIYINKEDEDVEVKNQNKIYIDFGVRPIISNIEVKRVTTDSRGRITYTDLDVAKKTNSNFICAGQVIYIRVKALNTSSVTLEIAGDRSIMTLDELTKKFEWTEPKERGTKTRFSSLKQLENQYKMPLQLKLEEETENGVKYFSTTYVIPYETKQTLHSWETLREIDKNAFEIDKEKLFTRIDDAYSLVLKARSDVGITTKRTSLDVFEAWNKIYNRDLSKYIK